MPADRSRRRLSAVCNRRDRHGPIGCKQDYSSRQAMRMPAAYMRVLLITRDVERPESCASSIVMNTIISSPRMIHTATNHIAPTSLHACDAFPLHRYDNGRLLHDDQEERTHPQGDRERVDEPLAREVVFGEDDLQRECTNAQSEQAGQGDAHVSNQFTSSEVPAPVGPKRGTDGADVPLPSRVDPQIQAIPGEAV